MLIMFTYNIFFVRAASIDGLVPFLVAWLLCQINIIIMISKTKVVFVLLLTATSLDTDSLILELPRQRYFRPLTTHSVIQIYVTSYSIVIFYVYSCILDPSMQTFFLGVLVLTMNICTFACFRFTVLSCKYIWMFVSALNDCISASAKQSLKSNT